MKTKVKLHGEVIIRKSELPKDAVQIKPSNNSCHIVADSETTGNHHVVEYCDDTKIYTHEDKLFMVNTQPTKFKCVVADRHDEVVLEPDVWEFGTQKEYDHITEELINVRD